jgi:4-amino-4-deoxy-L-arabinose transferase and related glycosyltransferases of PMT family
VLTRPQRIFVIGVFMAAIAGLYLYNLTGTGVLDPDEPRYASVGRAMAQSGDWVTPRLWGSPWFEKPALLYWLAGVGTLSGLSPDLAGRLPVALLSLAFLAAWFLLLRAEFGERTAAIAALLLATSAAWLVYSSLCLTDLPLAVFFSMAVVLALPLLRGRDSRAHWLGLGASLGLATLAKGLVPIALAIPFLWFLRRQWRRWWIAAAALFVVATPWYALVIARNGYPFVEDFFLKQHFARFYSQTLQHVQPAYFYVPVLLGTLFPWTPLLLLIRPQLLRKDERLQFLMAVFAFGFVFFSVSLNKLPGYLLPLLPCLFVPIAAGIAEHRMIHLSRGWLIASGVLIALIPFAGQLIPVLLLAKITSANQVFLAMLPISLGMLVLFVTPLAVAAFGDKRVAGALLVLSCAVAAIYLKSTVYPVLDKQASARSLWHQIEGESDRICDAGLKRTWQYGLAFYRGSPVPLCAQFPKPVRLVPGPSGRPVVLKPR